MKLTTQEIDSKINPLNKYNARQFIGLYIIKRPEVFADDDGSVYKIIGITEEGFSFWEKDYLHTNYRFENIMYDYIFMNGRLIGTEKGEVK